MASLGLSYKHLINDKTNWKFTLLGSSYRQADNRNFLQSDYSEIIRNWRITNYSYDYVLNQQGNAFVYLDPPYDIKDNLYGKKGSMHKGFDHDKFAADCSASKLHQLVSYNSDQLVRDRFTDWNAAEFDLPCRNHSA